MRPGPWARACARPGPRVTGAAKPRGAGVAGPRPRRGRQTGNRGCRQLRQHRVAGREGVVHLQNVETDPHHTSARECLEHARLRDLNHVRLQATERPEDWLAVGARDVYSVERDDVEVRIESHVARAALNDRQQSPLCPPVARRQPAFVPTQKRVLEHPRHESQQSRLIRQRRTQGVGQAQHPLPQWLRWQHVRKQVVRRLVHPTTKARGAKATTGAREGDQSRQAATFARQVCEASLHDATVEVPRELGAHKVRQSGLPPFLDGRIERRQVFPHHLVQRLRKGVVFLVDPWPPPHSGGGGDVGQSLSAMRTACHRLPLSVRLARSCS